MAEHEAMGFVETQGLVAAIEAADAMVKAARVRIKTVGNADAALISVICEGDLAACAAAVDAGKTDAQTLQDTVKRIDKAAEYGVFHPNKASRLKSRLAKAANKAKAAAAK